MSEGSALSQFKVQVSTLSTAQRLGIFAAVAMSSSLVFMVYATKKHRLICGGPIESPRHRSKCPLNFLTFSGNDINDSNATIMTPDRDSEPWDLDPFEFPTPSLRKNQNPPPLLSCPHTESLAGHPHMQVCLPCEESRHTLDRAYMNWSPATEVMTSSPTILSCPHNNLFAGSHSQACLQCEERRYTVILERNRMNWTTSPLSPAVDSSPAYSFNSDQDSEPSQGDDHSSSSSYKSPKIQFQFMPDNRMTQTDPIIPTPQQAQQALVVGISSTVTCVNDSLTGINLGLNWGVNGAMTSIGKGISNTLTGINRGFNEMITSIRNDDDHGFTRQTIGKTTIYSLFWYICTLCNDKCREERTTSILERFPAPHMLQAFGFAFQAYFLYEVQRRNLLSTARPHASWTVCMDKVVPLAIASSFDMAIDLAHGGVDDQYITLSKSGSPIFILILTYLFYFEDPSFNLTAGIACLTIGSLLTIGKALDYKYESRDVLALIVGAFLNALRWTGAQYLLQQEDGGSTIATISRVAPWMTIFTLAFSMAFEKSWQIMSTQYFFVSPMNMLEGIAQLLIFYVLWTIQILAEFMLIAKTSAVTFIVLKVLKNVADSMGHITEKGWYYEERRYLFTREKTMNEETVGLQYIVMGLILFFWHRFQKWAQSRADVIAGRQHFKPPASSESAQRLRLTEAFTTQTSQTCSGLQPKSAQTL